MDDQTHVLWAIVTCVLESSSGWTPHPKKRKEKTARWWKTYRDTQVPHWQSTPQRAANIQWNQDARVHIYCCLVFPWHTEVFMWWVVAQRMEGLCSSHTPMKTLAYHDSLAFHHLHQLVSSVSIPNQGHLFSSQTPTLPPLLCISSLLTPSLITGPLCDPRCCFSTLLTASDHNTIKGI